ncbi:MAG: histidine phosphatase family protein [Bacteroidales bacterium]
MKHLMLFRHGKSSWDHPGLSDIDRPLLSKGEQRTRKVAGHMKEKLGITSGLIVTSHAKRAFQTASIVAGILGIQGKAFLTEQNLYHASVDRIWDVIIALPDDIDRVMLFGHNPGFTEFVNQAGIASIDWLPTSGVASAVFKCDHWHECPLARPEDSFILLPSKI